MLRHRSGKRHSNMSERSVSADSGLGSPSTTDKTLNDVSDSDVFDEVMRCNSSENLSPRHRTSSTTSSSGLFGAYINRHSLGSDDHNHYHFGGQTFRGADAPFNTNAGSDADSVLTSEMHVDDVTRLPDHLDSFADVAEAIVRQLKKQKKRSDRSDEDDDVFDERWHVGHDYGDDCPFCREFERATRRRVDRFFGGTESFLTWIFSKWGKVSASGH